MAAAATEQDGLRRRIVASRGRSEWGRLLPGALRGALAAIRALMIRNGSHRLAAGIALILPGCGAELPPRASVLSVRVEGLVPEAKAEVVWSDSPGDEGPPWQVRAVSSARLATDHGQALKVDGGEGGEPVLLSCRGSWELSSFDQLLLRGGANDKTRVQLAFRRAGRLLGSTAPVPMTQGPPGSLTSIDLPANLGQLGRADTLALIFDGRPRGVIIEELQLLRRPAAGLVPDPQEPARLVFLDNVARLGLGLIARRPLVSEFEVPQGALLRFAVGRPPAADPHGVIVVHCQGDSADQFIERQLPLERILPREPGRAPGWQSVSIDLASLEGQRVIVRWRLDPGEGGFGRGAALVAEPVLDVPGKDRTTPRQVVLLVTSDTHRADHLGLARSAVSVSTPNLDGLARRGVFFEQCFSSTNFTNPSHVAMMTAVHPRDTGILDNTHALDGRARTLAEVFADAGWDTWAVTSAAHLRPSVSGLGQGFARFARTPGVQRSATDAVAQALDWLDEGGSRPVFLWLHLFDAHMPYEAPAPFDRLGYDGPADPFDENLPDPHPEGSLPGNMAGLRVLDFGRKEYAAQISYLDHELGRLLQRQALARGVVAMVGDHGEVLGAHGIWFDHAELYTDTLHVPLALAWPGAPGGSRRSDRVSSLDLGRTLLDLAGLERQSFPGRSLLSAAAPRPLFALSSHGTSASISSGPWHLILHLMAHNRVYAAHQLELFNLADDPGCTRDLIHEATQDVVPLARQLSTWLAERRELGLRGREAADEETLRGLSELGYLAGSGTPAGQPLFLPDRCDWCALWR